MNLESPRGQLTDLLVGLFPGASLRAFIEKLDGGPRLLTELPSPPVAPMTLAFEASGVLDCQGYVDTELFVALVRTVPRKRAKIERVARSWGFTLPPATSEASSKTADSPVSGESTPRIPVAPTSASPPADLAPETWDVFVSYAHADREPVERLAINLHELGLRVFFDAWELGLGDVVQHRLEVGLRDSKSGVLIVSRTSVTRPWVMEEYAVMLDQAVREGRLLVPVVLDDTEPPPMLRTRLWLNLREKTGEAYQAELDRLVRALRGERPGPPVRTGKLQSP